MKPFFVCFLLFWASFESALVADHGNLISSLAPTFGGVVYDTQRKVDIVEEQNARPKSALINAQPDSLFVRYQSLPQSFNASKYKITVFTDTDCPFCRQLHNSIDILNERDVTVNYVMLPRSGRDSVSYAKTQNALCSDSPSASITRPCAICRQH